MAVQRSARPTANRPRIAVALHLVLRLLALLVFAQAALAGLFLDRNAAWRRWHASNGILLIPLLALLALLLTIVVQNALGQNGQVAVHIPLGVTILGLIGALQGRTRHLARAPTDPSTPSGKLR